MRLIGLVILSASLALAPLAAKAQQAEKIAQLGYLGTDRAAIPTCTRPSVKNCVTSVTSRAATL